MAEEAGMEEVDSGKPLRDKQLQFAIEYCLDFNLSQAAIRAGYAKTIAGHMGHILYKDPRVKAEIKKILSSRRQEYDVTVERLKTEISRIAFADITDLFETIKDGKLNIVSLRELPKRVRSAIKTVRPTKYGIEVEFHNKLGALEMLAKHFGFYEKDNSQKKQEGVGIYLPDNGREDAFEEDTTEEL